jgi:hypothetical protein
MGERDGLLRANRRWGRCAWSYGAHPAWVLLGGLHRMTRRPYVLGGLSYVWGWAAAALTRKPCAEPETRALARAENLGALRERIAFRGPRRGRAAEGVLG